MTLATTSSSVQRPAIRNKRQSCRLIFSGFAMEKQSELTMEVGGCGSRSHSEFFFRKIVPK